MRAGILGPTDMKKLEFSGIDPQRGNTLCKTTGKILANLGYDLVLVPEDGGAQDLVSKAYRENSGNRIFGIVPTKDKTFGIENLDLAMVDEVIEVQNWGEVHYKLHLESDIAICLGLSGGTLVDLGMMKYTWRKYNKPKALLSFVDLPPVLEFEMEVASLPFVKLDPSNPSGLLDLLKTFKKE